LDVVFDSGKSDIYYQKRDYYFPLDRSGSVQFRNRAGDKLWQVRFSPCRYANSMC